MTEFTFRKIQEKESILEEKNTAKKSSQIALEIQKQLQKLKFLKIHKKRIKTEEQKVQRKRIFKNPLSTKNQDYQKNSFLEFFKAMKK